MVAAGDASRVLALLAKLTLTQPQARARDALRTAAKPANRGLLRYSLSVIGQHPEAPRLKVLRQIRVAPSQLLDVALYYRLLLVVVASPASHLPHTAQQHARRWYSHVPHAHSLVHHPPSYLQYRFSACPLLHCKELIITPASVPEVFTLAIVDPLSHLPSTYSHALIVPRSGLSLLIILVTRLIPHPAPNSFGSTGLCRLTSLQCITLVLSYMNHP